METLELLRRRINSTEDLGSIVKTMKSIAAVSIRQYERAVEALEEYHRTTAMGLSVVLAEQAEELETRLAWDGDRVGVIIFGSDQGMVGQFNEHIAAYVTESLESLDLDPQDCIFLPVGVRLAAPLEDAGYPLDHLLVVPSSVSAIALRVQEMLMLIEGWRRDHQVGRVYAFHNRMHSGLSYSPYGARLLPISLESLQSQKTRGWQSRSLPIYTMERTQLLSALIRQHLFVQLYRAFAESLASENSSRLAAMQAAEKNIGERLDELNMLFNARRQGAITSELLDIVSGFEALSGKRKPKENKPSNG